MIKNSITDYLDGTNSIPIELTKKFQAELLELKLKKTYTLTDKYRIQKIQQLLDGVSNM